MLVSRLSLPAPERQRSLCCEPETRDADVGVRDGGAASGRDVSVNKYDGLTRSQFREKVIRKEREELVRLRRDYLRLWALCIALLNALDEQRRAGWEAEVLDDGGLIEASYDDGTL